MEEDLVKRAGVPYKSIPAAGVAGVGVGALPGNLWRLVRGFLASRHILKEFKPEAMFFTGGYLAVPVALAGWLPAAGVKRPRSLLYVPDIEPGLALKTLARLADHIAISAEDSRAYLSQQKRTTVSGYPVRQDLKTWTPESARQALGLSAGLPTLLVSGGSRGARQINRAIMTLLPDLLTSMQVVHVTGKLDWPEVQAAWQNLLETGAVTGEQASRYHLYPYLYEEMGAAMSAADLAVSRAGASTLGEFPLFGLPAVLVPYPYAWRYQRVNAQYLAGRGAAVWLAETGEDLAPRLLAQVRELVNDPARLQEMRQAMLSLSRPKAAETIGDILLSLAADAARSGKVQWSA